MSEESASKPEKLVQFTNVAEDPVIRARQYRQFANMRKLREAGTALLGGGLVLGAGYRGLQELFGAARKRRRPSAAGSDWAHSRALLLAEEEREKKKPKYAAPSLLSVGTAKVAEEPVKTYRLGSGSWLLGGNAENLLETPVATPVVLGSAGLGIGSGWKMTDWLLRARRNRIAKEDAERAERRYKKLLAGRADAVAPKLAGDEGSDGEEQVVDKLRQELDALHADCVKVAEASKTADIPGSVLRSSGLAAGGLLTAAGALALLAGTATYEKTRRVQEAAALKAAIKAKRRRAFAQMPGSRAAVVVAPDDIIKMRKPEKAIQARLENRLG